MKKLIITGLMIATLGNTVFAQNRPQIEEKPLPPHLHKMKKARDYKKNPEMERIRILIDEKRLDIRKELLNENPDWNKIEKLNIDIATEEAKLKTCRMRENYEREYSIQK